jgi:hypothetical protein
LACILFLLGILGLLIVGISSVVMDECLERSGQRNLRLFGRAFTLVFAACLGLSTASESTVSLVVKTPGLVIRAEVVSFLVPLLGCWFSRFWGHDLPRILWVVVSAWRLCGFGFLLLGALAAGTVILLLKSLDLRRQGDDLFLFCRWGLLKTGSPPVFVSDQSYLHQRFDRDVLSVVELVLLPFDLFHEFLVWHCTVSRENIDEQVRGCFSLSGQGFRLSLYLLVEELDVVSDSGHVRV